MKKGASTGSKRLVFQNSLGPGLLHHHFLRGFLRRFLRFLCHGWLPPQVCRSSAECFTACSPALVTPVYGRACPVSRRFRDSRVFFGLFLRSAGERSAVVAVARQNRQSFPPHAHFDGVVIDLFVAPRIVNQGVLIARFFGDARVELGKRVGLRSVESAPPVS